MTSLTQKTHRAITVALISTIVLSTLWLSGCDQKSADAQLKTPASTGDQLENNNFEPVTIEHKLGSTTIKQRPQRIAALDMNEVDLLDQLQIPVAGMPKDFVPQFLMKYANDPDVLDLGAIVQPNMERLYSMKPDLILISPLQANHFEELSNLAPTLHFDVDYNNSSGDHFDIVKSHLISLGKIFGKEELARKKAAELDAQFQLAKKAIQDRPEKAMIVIHNNGAYQFLGEKSRYGFVHSALGVKSVNSDIDAGPHGQPISSEFIYENNPDIIYVLDRTAVMQRQSGIDAQTMDNPLLRETNAWKNGRIIFVDSEAWYIAGASVSSLEIIVNDVLKGYASK